MKKIVKIFAILLILTSCQASKEAFTLKKKNNADEFLVEKKSPLVLPPEYGKLPLPTENNTKNTQADGEIASILGGEDKNTSSAEMENNSEPMSIEKSILEKIK